jgi:hypothetical protein
VTLSSPAIGRPLAAAQTLVLAAFIMACTASSPPTVTPIVPTADPAAGPTVDPAAKPLAIGLRSTEVAPGQERVAFTLAMDGQEVTDGTVTVTVYRLSNTGAATKAASGAAAYFGTGLPGGGNWVVYTDFDASGEWGFQVDLDHQTLGKGNGRVNLLVSGRPRTPKVGDKPTGVDTPTAGAEGLAAITSDPEPDPELYAMTVGEAMASGKPTVVFFGSPKHCPTALCAVSLAALKQVKAQFAGQVNFIHVETRDLADPSKLSAATQAWGLPSEPWTFVLDKAGRVNTRLEGGLDGLELGAVLQQKLGLGG